MASANVDTPEVKKKLYELFREYFKLAEKKRRWNLDEDINWTTCNHNIKPAVSDVIWTFCAVELFLPDYLGKTLPSVRDNRGRSWMMANWGYEESKHSMALGDWLLKSKWRTEEEMFDMEQGLFKAEYELPYGNSTGMVCYTTIQELATGLHYRNLRRVVGGKCPTLDHILNLISIDESAHADFFRRIVEIYMEVDRKEMLAYLSHAFTNFQMPAFSLFLDSRQRGQAIRELNIFDESLYYEHVVQPILRKLGITRQELKIHTRKEWTSIPGAVPID